MHKRLGSIIAVILLSVSVYAVLGSLFPDAPLNANEVMLVTLMAGVAVVGVRSLFSRIWPRRSNEKPS